jgi:hypothetical protein
MRRARDRSDGPSLAANHFGPAHNLLITEKNIKTVSIRRERGGLSEFAASPSPPTGRPPSPILPQASASGLARSQLLPPRRGGGFIDRPAPATRCQHDPVVALGRLRRDIALQHIVEHPLGLAHERIAMAAAAGGVAPEY